jgi:hypothetical protein
MMWATIIHLDIKSLVNYYFLLFLDIQEGNKNLMTRQAEVRLYLLN